VTQELTKIALMIQDHPDTLLQLRDSHFSYALDNDSSRNVQAVQYIPHIVQDTIGNVSHTGFARCFDEFGLGVLERVGSQLALSHFSL
jgi:hypothetical protein